MHPLEIFFLITTLIALAFIAPLLLAGRKQWSNGYEAGLAASRTEYRARIEALNADLGRHQQLSAVATRAFPSELQLPGPELQMLREAAKALRLAARVYTAARMIPPARDTARLSASLQALIDRVPVPAATAEAA